MGFKSISDRFRILARRQGAFTCTRLYGFAAQYGIDACSDRWSPTRPHLALFCSFPVSDLSFATTASIYDKTDA